VDAELQGLLIIILKLLKKPVHIGNAIGAGQALDTGTLFSGLIDDVRIYDVALTAQEIAAIAQ